MEDNEVEVRGAEVGGNFENTFIDEISERRLSKNTNGVLSDFFYVAER